METSIVISGFGGQGVLFAGQLLAYAGMDNGRYVTWIPSYGPEMRGGTANCTVIISHDPIGAPIVAQPDIALVFNLPSYEKYADLVKPGGLLVVNNSIVTPDEPRDDLNLVEIPANGIAGEFGTVKMLNMAMIGAMLAHHDVLPITALEEALRDHLPARKQQFLQGNLDVLHAGARAAAKQTALT
ncbi:2-oxoacid:acceptor oxidoreductase family protein [Candidatus Leptofilum sp.]|uniref:2-oxoacid:acceptor oxidoreductase family protein n=1 Tax=Candidatus Leptofilum sp. TaxID=3241576 RepID=UPI003B5B3281